MELVGYARAGIDELPLEMHTAQLLSFGCRHIWTDDQSDLDQGPFHDLEQAIQQASSSVLVVTSLHSIADSLKELAQTLRKLKAVDAHFVCLGQPEVDTTGQEGWKILELLDALIGLEEGGQQRKREAGIVDSDAAPKARGRKRKLSVDAVIDLHQLGLKPEAIAETLGISRPTVYRYLNRANRGDVEHPQAITSNQRLLCR